MRRAIALARRGWGQTAPNPMVGAVVVRDGEVVGEGWHARWGGAHAEVAALEAAGDRARGATVYVTLEPCAHHGKTPPCVDALLAARVARVVVATRDPNAASSGGVERLTAAGVRVDVGVEAEAAREADAAYFHAHASDRPWVTLKLALSLDSAVADAHGQSRWITGEASRREVHRLRAGHDAVAVGGMTAAVDDPALTVRDAEPPRVPPVRVVFGSPARIALDSILVRTASEVPVVVVTAEPETPSGAALRARGVEVLQAGDLAAGVRALRARGIRSLLVEGGARLAASFIEGALADRLVIFRAPVVLGAGALGAFAHLPGAAPDRAPRWRVLERRMFGDDEMTVLAISPTPEVR